MDPLPTPVMQEEIPRHRHRREDLCLDPRGPVFEAPLPVRHAPEPLEEDPRQRIFGREFLILEKSRLDVPCPHVGSFPRRCF